ITIFNVLIPCKIPAIMGKSITSNFSYISNGNWNILVFNLINCVFEKVKSATFSNFLLNCGCHFNLRRFIVQYYLEMILTLFFIMGLNFTNIQYREWRKLLYKD